MELMWMRFHEKRLEKGADDFSDEWKVEKVAVNVKDGFFKQELSKFGAEFVDETWVNFKVTLFFELYKVDFEEHETGHN
jgi:hypothetical protein